MTKRRTEAKVIKVDFNRSKKAKAGKGAKHHQSSRAPSFKPAYARSGPSAGRPDGVWRVAGVRIPFAREGFPFILLSVMFTASVFVFPGLWWIKGPLIAITVFVAAFFRDPERRIPEDPNSIVSPADGLIIKVEDVVDDRFLRSRARKVSVFMNVFNVHVNRAPADLQISKVVYNPGRFFNASLDKASLENEQNAVIADGPGGRFAFNQIAGLVARRIVCRVKAGDRLKRGERFGLIRFGSRVDVFLPQGCKITVKAGDKVRAGSSIIGYWR